MVISKRENVTKHVFCKILRGKFRPPGSLSVIHVLHFNFNLIVTQVNKWILWCCILDVRHRNVGKWVSRPRSRYSLFKFKWEGEGEGEGRRVGVGWALINWWIRYVICIGFLHVLNWSCPKLLPLSQSDIFGRPSLLIIAIQCILIIRREKHNLPKLLFIKKFSAFLGL